MRRKRKKSRTPEQVIKLSKKVVDYYFANPDANGYAVMIQKFKVNKSFIRKALSNELDKRFKHAKEHDY
tara:strand:+ start:170 stop:376 length:207 start_codon:yes stop_codon:yes gene_type:complete